MGYGFTTSLLKEQIANDLKIDVAFPFFSFGKDKGTAACCVVDTEWIDTVRNGTNTATTTTRTATTNDKLITVKTPAHVRHIPTDPSQQKQAPTVNIYVDMLLKDTITTKKLSLYHQPNTLKGQQQHQASRYQQQWPLTTYIHALLEGKDRDEKMQELVDSFSNFDSIFDCLEMTSVDRNAVLIHRIHRTLWPTSKLYRVEPAQEPTAMNDSKNSLILRDIADEISSLLTAPHLSAIATAKQQIDTSNSNLPDVFAIVESATAYYFLATYHGTTLQDLITYNPGVLDSNLKKGFVIYQLLRTVAGLHSRGIIHGNLRASNILIDENLWIQLAGTQYGSNTSEDNKVAGTETQRYPLYQEVNEEPLVTQWVRGEISNYSYLMILNRLAGRREGDPNFHPILPWITDFSGSSIENGWRDFTKTKFRINKGDEQLDFTFDGPVPHHITDILSDITYYVYLARRTPVPVLCQFVRTKYEPNEYPSSMQRLYQWTPDECIPEFYTDPTIFKSIHEDMPDLQFPSWSTSPEDFIVQHARALESDYVSSMLHHWIDLTFGNRLTGKEAIESKNVALPLLAGQNSFMKHGIIQLFQDNHPQRGCNWNKAKRTYEKSFSQKVHQSTADTLPPLILETSSSDQSSNISQSTQNNTKHLSTLHQSQLQQQHPQQSQQQQQPPSQQCQQNYCHNQSVSVSTSPLSTTSTTATTTNSKHGFCENPSSLTLGSRDRASSVHSTSSSIDTSLSVTSKAVSFDNTGIIGGLNALNGLTVMASNNLSSVLRTEPIRLPTELPDDYFMEKLTHYEDMMKFSAVNKSALDEVHDIPKNPVLSDDDPLMKRRYNINPNDPLLLATNIYSMETAYDMLCAGQIMEKILMAGSQKRVTLDAEASDTYGGTNNSGASNYVFLETDRGEISYDISPAERMAVSPEVTGVIAALKSDYWYERPTAKSILFASFPVMTVRNPRYSFPLADQIPDMYEYLAGFYQAEWSRRLYLADKWIDRICELEDEAFLLILPSFIQLFTHSETRVGSVGLFSKLAHRLGRERTRKYLLKPIISMFETLRPAIPKVLFDTKLLKEFIKRLGIPLFLQQMLPCYLEALATNNGSHQTTVAAPSTSSSLSSSLVNSSSNDLTDNLSPTPLSPSLATTACSPNSVPELASDSLIQICKLLGPVLTSKHIVRQLVKILFRDDSIKPILLDSVVAIAGTLFGETFTSVQYTYLISLLNVPTSEDMVNERNARTNYVVLILLGKLLPFMSNQAIITELKSGFMETLYKLLEPVLISPNPDDASDVDNEENQSPRAATLQLTISMRSIEYILQLTASLPLSDWESTIIPTLRKYFSGFISTVPTDDASIHKDSPNVDPRKNYQMMYAYSRLCEIVGKGTMHRLIPTSTAIEAMRYDDFSLGAKSPSPSPSPTLSQSDSVDKEDDTRQSPRASQLQTSASTTSTEANCNNNNNNKKLMSWIKLSSKKEDNQKQQDAKQRKLGGAITVGDTTRILDSTKLHDYATKGLYDFIPLLSNMPFQHMQDGSNVSDYLLHHRSKSPLVVSSPTSSVTDSNSTNNTSNRKVPTSSALLTTISSSNLQKAAERESYPSKNKIPTSVLPWKTKWKPSAEDKKNWNRFLSTNSEEMSKSMQFSFNDLKLRGFAGHTSSIRSFAVNEPDKVFASGSKDRTVKLWSLNVHKGIENWETEPYSESLLTYNGHRRGAIHDIHFLSAHNGQSDMIASSDGHVHLWHPETGKIVHQFNTGRSSIVSLKPFFQSRSLVGATMEGYLTFLDTHNQCLLHTWKSSATVTTGTIRAITVNQSETLIAVGYSTGTIALLETRTGALVANWKGGDTEVSLLKFYANDLLVTCAPADHLICCWNVNRLALVKTISASLDVISLDTFKDEVLTINGNNSVSFIPINDDTQSYSSKFKSSIVKSQVSAFTTISADQLLLFGCTEGEIFLYA